MLGRVDKDQFISAIMCDFSTEWLITIKHCTSSDFEDETDSSPGRTTERFLLLCGADTRATAQEPHNQNWLVDVK